MKRAETDQDRETGVGHVGRIGQPRLANEVELLFPPLPSSSVLEYILLLT
jgi:hypothetical protein